MGTLIKVKNPPKKEFEKFYKKAKKQYPTVTKKEVREAIKKFINMHGYAPTLSNLKIKDIKRDPQHKILVSVGQIGQIDYYTKGKKSRKTGYYYEHKVKNNKLYVSTDGKSFYTKGKMHLKDDGWLYE